MHSILYTSCYFETKILYLVNQMLETLRTISSVLIFCTSVTFNFCGNENQFTKALDQKISSRIQENSYSIIFPNSCYKVSFKN